MRSDLVIRRLGARRSLVFVVGVIALVNLHQRLHFGIVVAIIAALVGGQRMQKTDAAILFQIRIEHRSGVGGTLLLFAADRKHLHAAVVEDDVAMPVGIRDAALISE